MLERKFPCPCAYLTNSDASGCGLAPLDQRYTTAEEVQPGVWKVAMSTIFRDPEMLAILAHATHQRGSLVWKAPPDKEPAP